MVNQAGWAFHGVPGRPGCHQRIERPCVGNLRARQMFLTAQLTAGCLNPIASAKWAWPMFRSPSRSAIVRIRVTLECSTSADTDGGAWPVRCSGLPGVRSGRPRLRSSLGPAPARIGVGGSIPFVKQFGDRFGDRAPLILNGVLDPASALHAPNESLHLGATSHDPPSPTSGSRPTLGDKSSIGSSSRFATAPPTSSSTHSTSSPAWRLWFRVRD